MNLKEWNQHGYWLAALSNGYTIKEPDLFDGKTSPWTQLMSFLNKRKDIYITGLKYCLRSHMYNLPSKSNKDFKHARNEVKKPIGYNYFITAFSEADMAAKTVSNGSLRRLEAHYEDYKVCLYIDNISGESWVTIENADNNKVF